MASVEVRLSTQARKTYERLTRADRRLFKRVDRALDRLADRLNRDAKLRASKVVPLTG